MYTQCPECEVAFRVTADVLKQAAGKVRCGGCGSAFNALAHLSEEMPENAATENPPGEAGTPPQSISAEQSAALLKTLDQLAGEDIRIEDTGVEWRVIDAEEDEDIADDPVPSQVHEEMRFDDNTPLPDDFDLDAPSAPPLPPEPVVEEPEPEPQIDESQIDLVFGEPDEWEDLLDDLEEVAAENNDAPSADDLEVVEARAIEESEPAQVEDQDAEDEEVEVGEIEVEELELEYPEVDADADLDAQFARQAEELGLDLTGMQQALDEDAIEVDDAPADDDAQTDDSVEEISLELEDDEEVDLSDTSIEEDLIAAAFEVEAAAKAEAEAAAETEPEEVLEIDAEVEVETEPGEDLQIEVVEEEDPDEAVESDEPEETAEPVKDEINLDDVPPEELSRAGILDEDDYLEEFTAEDEADVLDDLELEASPADQALADALLDDEPAVEEVDEDELEDELVAEAELDDENQFGDEEELAASLEDALDEMQNVEYAEPDEIEVPELTEEEKTVNMMIDQELLAIAVEDDDGFTSTIVQKQVSSDEDIPAEKFDDDVADVIASSDDVEDAEDDEIESIADDGDEPVPAAAAAAAKDNPLMETIIMEGETVMNEEDQERLEAARAAASESMKQVDFEEDKSGFSFASLRDWRPPRHSAMAAAVLLFVVLIVQVIHQSREAMAVSPAFQSTIGPVYRMLGSPVIPAWDVTGWRFEATKGSTNEAGDVLTIYSRVGNNSGQPLPFPLVHVELKDRFEEVIGSRILEPSEYLVDDTDPSQPVPARETFNAVIAINSPSAAATSFKLNVCYRIGGGRLRCDDKDFR